MKTIALYIPKHEYVSWVVNLRNNTTIDHHTDHGPMGLGQSNSLGEYCGPHTASSVFLISLMSHKGFSNHVPPSVLSLPACRLPPILLGLCCDRGIIRTNKIVCKSRDDGGTIGKRPPTPPSLPSVLPFVLSHLRKGKKYKKTILNRRNDWRDLTGIFVILCPSPYFLLPNWTRLHFQ